MSHPAVRAPSSPGRFFGQLWRQVWGSLATLTLLTLMAVGLHHLHVFDATEGVFRRIVVEKSASAGLDESTRRRVAPEHTVSVVLVDAYMRIKDLEMDAGGLNQPLVARVGGIRPIDRCKFAALIDRLARQLEMPQNTQYLKVVGLDVDIAPVADGEIERGCSRDMAKAVKRLRNHVTVVAIVLERETEALRHVRNRFYLDDDDNGVGCTTSDNASRQLSPPMPHPLYLASPRVFHSSYSYPIDFPFEVAEPQGIDASKSWRPESKTVFPSLSNLLLASAFRSGSAYLKSSTMLCDEARLHSGPRAALQQQVLLEDRLAATLPSTCEDSPDAAECRTFSLKRYAARPINWRWLDSEEIRMMSLSSLEGLDKAGTAPGPGNDFFSAAALIVGVDGGRGNDKFQVAAVTADAIPGAQLHALQAVSMLDPGHALYLNSILTLLADFCVGLVFLVAWKFLSLLIDRHLAGTATAQMLRLVLPVLIALGLGWVCVRLLAPWLMNVNVWANPIYLLAGLVLHAYVEGAEGEHAAGHPHAGPDFTFGVGATWDQWRAQRRWDRSFVDRLFCTLLKLLVVGYGCLALWHFEGSNDPFAAATAPWHQPGLSHWGGWGVCLLAGIFIVAFVKRPKGEST